MLVIALIARRVAGDLAMLIAGVLAATYANLWIIDGILYSEGLFVLLVALVVLVAYHWQRPTDAPACRADRRAHRARRPRPR